MFASKKPVTVNGVHYDSINEAARALDMCPVTLSRWLKRGRSVKRHLGSQWEAPLVLDCAPGVEFWSVREGAEYLRISPYKANLLVNAQRMMDDYRKNPERKFGSATITLNPESFVITEVRPNEK